MRCLRWRSRWSLLAVPFVAAGVQIAHVLRLPEHYVAAICSLVLPALFTGLTAMLVALISEQLGGSPRGAFLASLTYAFGTIAMVYARTFYADPLLALLTVACIYLVLRIVAVWWWVLPAARIPRVVGVALSLILVALGCAALQWQAKGTS